MLYELFASYTEAQRNELHFLLLEALVADSPDAEPVRTLTQRLRALPAEQRTRIGLPMEPSDLEIYEYVIRRGAELLLVLERP